MTGDAASIVRLSRQQIGIWLLEEASDARGVFHTSFSYRLTGALDITALRCALAALSARHEVLRTVVRHTGEDPVGVVLSDPAVPVTLHDATELDDQALGASVEAARLAPFDLRHGPLLRADVFRQGPETSTLLVCCHHIACDGEALQLFRAELSAFYVAARTGTAPALEPAAPQYRDYAEYQYEQVATGDFAASITYWRNHLSGVAKQLEVPTDFPRPAVRSYQAGVSTWDVEPALAARVTEFCSAEGVTLFMLGHAALACLLGRLADSDDVLLGTAMANRQEADEKALGLFTNLVALRLHLTDGLTVRDLLRSAREEIVNAYEHQEVPLELLLAELGRSHEASHQQLFQATVQVLDRSGPQLCLDGLAAEPLPPAATTRLQFDLCLNIIVHRSGITLEFGYATDLFEATGIDALGRRLLRLLDAMTADAERPVADLPVLLPDDTELIARLNATRSELPAVGGVLDMISAFAAAHPEHPALIRGPVTLTYRELLDRADRVARVLVDAGIGEGSMIGVCLPRGCVDLVYVELGIWRAGCGYLVLNPEDPVDRLHFQLDDGDVALLITTAGMPALDVATVLLEELPDPDVPLPTELPGRGHRAYIVYTSGSTGVPKGVAIRHEGVLNLARWHHREFGTGSADRMTLSAAPWFDGWVLELWTGLSVGATMLLPEGPVVAGEDLRDWLVANEVSLPHFTTALAETLFDLDWPAESRVRTLLCGGERLGPHAWSRLPFGVYNNYGPTEGTVICTSGQVAERSHGRNPLVGHVLPNFSVRIVDSRDREQPVGALGEVVVQGIGMADGYWKRPDLTAERFVRLDLDDGLFYRTGDIGRWLREGELEIFGRTDDQVKIRGFRIELGEVEAVLTRHDLVAQAVVVVQEPTPGDRRLVAYLGCPAGSPADLRAHAAASLPTYMVPVGFVVLDRLPLTPNGKVDRRRLPEYVGGSTAGRSPRTAQEEVLCGLFADVLGVPRVTIDDSFFDLGGHSLLAMRLISRIRSTLDVELDVRTLFGNPTIAELADKFTAARPAVTRVDRTGHLPLSFAQQRLWFINQLEGGGFEYNMPFVFRITGDLDPSALHAALADVVARHESLRTLLPDVDGVPGQTILERATIDLPTVPYDSLTTLAHQGFDLAVDLPLRAARCEVGTGEHVLLIVLHHIAGDAWSMDPLLRDLSAAYEARVRGDAPAWPALPIQYADYAVWQRNLLDDFADRQLAFWRDALADLPEEITLPADRSRPAVASHHGGGVSFPLPAELHRGLVELARANQATVFMVVQAALAVLLSRLGGGADIPIGVPVAGRTDDSLNDLIGFFVNTLVLRNDVSGDPTFRDMIDRVRDTDLAAYAHQDVPFERLVEVLNPTRSMARHPLFQVMLAFGPVLTEDVAPDAIVALHLPGLDTATEQVDMPVAKFDLSFNLAERYTAGAPAGISGRLGYATDLFDQDTVHSLIERLSRLLTAVVADPDRPVGDVDLLTANERRRVLADWNDTAHEVPATTLPELFARQVQASPDATAVLFEDRTLSYRELDARANHLARRLIDQGVQPDDIVAIAMPRSLELVIALLGVLKAGAAYLPIDPDYPTERIAFMLEDTSPAASITAEATRHVIPGSIVLDARSAATAEDVHVTFPADTLAYAIYTSGSTGKPKAVGVPHTGLVNRLLWMQAEYHVSPADRIIQKTPYGFDVSVWEFFLPLITGATLVVAKPDGHRDPRYLATLLREQDITVAHFVPSMLALFLEEPTAAACTSLRVLICSGEALPADLRDRCIETFTAELHNLYGPTEASIDVTAWNTRENPATATVPIGRPIWNTKTYVLDERHHLVPPGVTGRLFLAGVGLARGYLGRPELTEERFVADPFGPGRMYDTGDLARWNPLGYLEFLGRADNQVKIRGLRVELGEIEATLLACDGVAQAVVVALDNRLVGYFVAHRGATVDPSRLRDRLSTELPAHMVPGQLVVLDVLPLSTNGKVDRRRLPAPAAAASSGRLPRSAPEEVLCALFADVLGRSQVTIDDSFFDLGGHSLLAMRLISRVRTTLDVELDVRTLFGAPTVAELAATLDKFGAARPTVTRADRGDHLPLSFAQQRLWFINQLEGGGFDYNMPFVFHITGDLDIPALQAALTDLVARHESLRTVLPDVDGVPNQTILPPDRFELPLIPHTEVTTLARRGFELAGDRPIRAALHEVGPYEHMLVIVLHHIAADAWSMDPFFRDLSIAYTARSRGESPAWPSLPVQYADYAVWQRNLLGSEDEETPLAARQLAFWRESLTGLPEEIALPADRPRPAVASHDGAGIAFDIPARLHQGLVELARANQATVFMVVQAALAVLLSRLGGGTDIPIGVPVAGRTDDALDDLIGFFVNTLVLRNDTAGNPTFQDMIDRVRDTDLAAYAHQDIPFERLVEILNPTRSMARHPLFQVALALGPATTENVASDTAATLCLPGLDTTLEQVDLPVAKFDLSFNLAERYTPTGAPAGISSRLQYATDLFDEDTVHSLADRLLRLLAAVVTDPGRQVGDVDLLTVVERRRVLSAWNDTAHEVPATTLPAVFAKQVQASPDATAVIFEDRALSYRELDARANHLARRLIDQGVQPDDIVAIAMPRSLELVIALLGVLKAGAAYLPIDPDYPTERIAFMLEDTSPAASITTAATQDLIPGSVVLDADDTGVSDDVQVTFPPDTLAYAIYTSGSTGKPKAVGVPHRGLVNRLLWMQAEYQVTPADRIIQKTPYGFDVSVWEFFLPLITGATLVVAKPDGHRDPAYLAAVIHGHDITIAHFVPSMLAMFLEEPTAAECTGLRVLICSGEALPADLRDRCIDTFDAQLHNLYGPTEASIDVTAWNCRENPGSTTVPIGRPIWNTKTYVLDERHHLVPPGVTGRLFLAGTGLARGYLGRPELTEQRFVTDPFGPGRMYDTGDLARWNPLGYLEFLGRADNQVKIRGLRVELGEIETTIAAHPAVGQAAVVVRGENQQLAAYVVPSGPAAPVAALTRMRRTGRVDEATLHELPNGMVVAGRNRSNVEFLYEEIFGRQDYFDGGLALPADACVVDVGAHIGMFSLSVAERAPRARIYAAEPVPELARFYRINAELHGVEAQLVECALGAEAGSTSFTYYPEMSIMSGRFADADEDREVVRRFLDGVDVDQSSMNDLLAERLHGEQIEVRLRTVSDLIAEHGLTRIDLLKIDAEKSELAVLRGILAEHWALVRQVVAEVHDRDGELAAIEELLSNNGFTVAVTASPAVSEAGLFMVYAARPGLAGTSTPTEDRWFNPDHLVRDLRAELSRQLPEHMVPDTFTVLDEMPVNPNGKLDRAALPEPVRGGGRGRPPRSSDEEVLAELFAQALDVERVDVEDSFFTMGGHSLLAIRLIGRIRTVLGGEVDVRTVFEAPSVAALAARLRHGPQAARLSDPVPLNASGSSPALFCVAPWVGLSWCYAPLVRALPSDQPLYGLQALGLDDVAEMAGSVNEAAAHHVEEIRAIQPHGPYHLLGWSSGGVVAHAVATQLQQAGEQVKLLALLDSHPRTRGDQPPTRVQYEQALLAYARLDQAEEGSVVDLLGEPRSAFAGLDAAQRTNLVAVGGNNLRIDAEHRPAVFDGDVVLFTAELSGDGAELARKWQPYVIGAVDLHRLDCTHEAMTEPAVVAQIGAILAKEQE